MILSSIKHGSLSENCNPALITLLLKKDKDPSICSSYRPISLLNTDMKLLAKILAKHLEPLMTKLVHPGQTGFVKSRISSDNVDCYILLMLRL